MTAAQATSANFDFGRVVSNTFRVVGANLRELSIIALLLAGLPAAHLVPTAEASTHSIWQSVPVTAGTAITVSAIAARRTSRRGRIEARMPP